MLDDEPGKILRNEEGGELGETAGVEAFVPLALILAVGGVGLEDVAVAGFELAVDGGLLDCTGADVVAEDAEKKGIRFAETVEDGYEFLQVFAEEGVGLGLGELAAAAVGFAGLDAVAVADVGPVLWVVHGFVFLDDYHCAFKGWQ